MLAVLLLLCVFFSAATTHQEVATGQEGGETLAAQILARSARPSGVVIVTLPAGNNADFAAALQTRLREGHIPVLDTITGDPPQARQALAALAQARQSARACRHHARMPRLGRMERPADAVPRLCQCGGACAHGHAAAPRSSRPATCAILPIRSP